MVKYCLDKYPLGSFHQQKTAGKFMDGYLYSTIEVFARNIVRDMTFLGSIFSSTLEVGTGKSVLAQQIGEAYTEMVNKFHGLEIPFNIDNVVFRPQDLIDVAFKVPKYSCIILDEWEDAHYWSVMGMTLRRFFRKCRQLNLFLIIIIPSFFDLPIGYALPRSVFAIDVKFSGEFERGFFDFYNFERKKDLYVYGKKTRNYKVVKCNFFGRFGDGYAVGEQEYREKKLHDMEQDDSDEQIKVSGVQVKGDLLLKVIKYYDENKELPKTYTDWGKAMGVDRSSVTNWFKTAEKANKSLLAEELEGK